MANKKILFEKAKILGLTTHQIVDSPFDLQKKKGVQPAFGLDKRKF